MTKNKQSVYSDEYDEAASLNNGPNGPGTTFAILIIFLILVGVVLLHGCTLAQGVIADRSAKQSEGQLSDMVRMTVK